MPFIIFNANMKYGVTKNTLLITAGIVWLLAGINILRIGISCWINDSHYWFFKVCEATIVFLLFFGLIFHKLYKKHTHRISQKKAKNCPFSFFDVKGWIIMAFMITIGILTRTLHLLPEAFIAVFYTGLSVALITTGTRFIWYWWRNRHLLVKSFGLQGFPRRMLFFPRTMATKPPQKKRQYHQSLFQIACFKKSTGYPTG